MNNSEKRGKTTPPSAGAGRYRLGDIIIDVEQCRVERDGVEIQLPKLTFDLLVALTGAAPRIVSRDELAKQVWGGRFVEPATIKQRMVLLRQALGDDAERPRYVRVVRGMGYGVIPDVRPVAVETQASRTWRLSALWSLGAVLLLTAIIVALNQWREPDAVESDSVPSVGVLPMFGSPADNDQAYFSEGIVTGLQELLRGNSGLRVVSAFPYRNSEMSLLQIAERLNVDHVLKVAVRRVGNAVKITAELVDTSTTRVLWEATFDRDMNEVFAIQEEISAAVTSRLHVSSVTATLDKTRLDVYSLYLRARYINNAALIDSLADARQMLEQAVELDDQYLPARLELAKTLNLMAGRHLPLGEARRLVRATINAAAAISPNRPIIGAWRGYIAFRYDGDFETAARYYENALSTNLSDIDSLRGAMTFALFLNRPVDSMRIANYLLARDTVCVPCYVHVLIGYIKTEQYAKVDETYREVTQLKFDRGSLALNYAWSLLLRGDAAAALAERTKFGDEPGMNLGEAALSAVAFHALGRQEESDANFAKLLALTELDNNLVPIARVYALTGDMDSACEILKAIPELDFMVFDDGPFGYGLQDMRLHSCWQDLAQKVGLWPIDPREKISFNVTLPQ